MDDVTNAGGSTAAATTSETSSEASSAHLSPQSSPGASSNSATTAPAESREREALRRLTAGEDARKINTDLNSRPAAAAKKPAAATADATAAGATKQPTAAGATAAPGDQGGANPSQAGSKESGETFGLNEKELNALRRGKFDTAHLAHMPLSNRQAIARNMLASQAEADRQFQAAKKGSNPADGSQAAAGKDETNPPDDQEEATQAGDGSKGAKNGKAATAANPGEQQAASQQQPSFFKPFELPDSDFQTLVDIGGDEFAKTYKDGMTGLARHYEGQVNTLVGILDSFAQRFENQDFNEGLSELRKTPGYEAMNDADLPKLREQAALLVRATGDLSKMNFKDAVSIAAASLYRTSVHQTAQTRLLEQKKQSMHGQPDKGSQRNATARPMSDRDRSQAILRLMQQGKSGEDARREVDAA